jgi:hypothetical protein
MSDQDLKPSKYDPIKLRGDGPNASEIILRDRDRFATLEQQNEAAPKVKETQATPRFNPVPIRGEPLSATIIRNRGE